MICVIRSSCRRWSPISERAGLWTWRRGQLRCRTTRSEIEVPPFGQDTERLAAQSAYEEHLHSSHDELSRLHKLIHNELTKLVSCGEISRVGWPHTYLPKPERLNMSVCEKIEQPSQSETIVPELHSDILVLGAYLAKRKGMGLAEFLEYLITKEATKGWSFEPRETADMRS